MVTTKSKTGIVLLILTGLFLIVGLAVSNPMVQDELYHGFCSNQTLFGIPNFWNVISNLPFLIVGVFGLKKLIVPSEIKYMYRVFFFGIALVAFGSGYYHYMPNNETLIWDRLPMTIAFMALFSIIISEFISITLGKKLFWVLISFGLISILYWVFGTEQDLRLYVFVQFYPILAIPIILVFFNSKYSKTSGYWFLLIAYILSKLFEHFDHEIGGFISMGGHPLKHLAAAIGLFLLLRSYRMRVLKK